MWRLFNCLIFKNYKLNIKRHEKKVVAFYCMGKMKIAYITFLLLLTFFFTSSKREREAESLQKWVIGGLFL